MTLEEISTPMRIIAALLPFFNFRNKNDTNVYSIVDVHYKIWKFRHELYSSQMRDLCHIWNEVSSCVASISLFQEKDMEKVIFISRLLPLSYLRREHANILFYFGCAGRHMLPIICWHVNSWGNQPHSFRFFY